MDSTWTSHHPRVRNRDPDLPSYKSVVEKDLPAVRARAYDLYVAAFPNTKFGNLDELEVHNQEIAQKHLDHAYHKHRKQIKKATGAVQIRAFEIYISHHPVTPYSTIWQVQAQNYKQADHYINRAYITLAKELLALKAKRTADHVREAQKAAQIPLPDEEGQQEGGLEVLSQPSSEASVSVRQFGKGGSLVSTQEVGMAQEDLEKEEQNKKLKERENLWILIGQQRRLYRHNCLQDKTNTDRQGGKRKSEDTKIIGARLKQKEKAWKEMKKSQGELVKKHLDWRNHELEEKSCFLPRMWFRMRNPLWRYKGQKFEVSESGF